MSSTQQLILGEGAGGAPAGYQIERSLRFNSADSANLTRTPASAGNRKTWTWSAWFKRSSIDANYRSLFCAGSGSTNVYVILDNAYGLNIQGSNAGSNDFSRTTSALLRDPSAWYHIVAVLDAGNTSAKLYLNGVEQTATGTQPSNVDYALNSTSYVHRIGIGVDGSSYPVDGYLTEVNFIDGQALTPSDFGETDSATGVWKPKAYTGTYGTNGFFLKFADNSNTTSTTLGKDYSGNGNNWTPSGFSVTAGAGNDSLVDTPTSYGTDTGAGGEVRGNYVTQNALVQTSNLSLSNGNLTITGSGAYSTTPATLGMSSGKWYWEYTCTTYSASGNTHYGIGTGAFNIYQNTWAGSTSAGWIYAASDGNKYNNNSAVAYGATFTSGDIIGVAFDADAGTLTFYKNGTSQGTAYTGLTSGPYFPLATVGTSNATNANFGQRPFAYTAPSGFKALCTQNLPTPTIGATSTTQANDYFNAVLWTGNGSDPRNITGVGFAPDFVWGKSRSSAYNHRLYDIVRGAQKALLSNSTDAETTADDTMTAFLSDGFTVKNSLNTNADTYVSWNWNAGGSNATNTAGTITSTVRANTTSGFSIVTYTGTGAAATIGHGLGVAPKMIIVKSRDQGTTGYTGNWYVYHASNTSAPETDYLLLNTTAATADDTFWNDTAPTSTVFSVGALSGTNDTSDKFVAYCFAEVAGYSAFGSITGNGSTDGPFCYLGFRPAFVMLKRTDSTSNWTILDFQREGYNVDNDPLYPNLSDAEGTADLADLLSNGFKLRSTDTSVNANGGTYVYAAFAQNPFKYSLAR